MPEPIADLFQIKLLLGALETTWKGHLAIKGAKKDQRGKLSHFFPVELAPYKYISKIIYSQ